MKLIIGLCLFLIIATIGVGVFYYLQASIQEGNRKLKIILGTNVSIYIPLIVIGTILAFSGTADAVEPSTSVASDSAGLGYIAAALSTGLATIGAGYAVGSVGSSALGAVSEDPKILGKTLIFVGLAEGIAIYGLIVSILILGRL
jgi:V/A-type H+-transporting ATPase subunit K